MYELRKDSKIVKHVDMIGKAFYLGFHPSFGDTHINFNVDNTGVMSLDMRSLKENISMAGIVLRAKAYEHPVEQSPTDIAADMYVTDAGLRDTQWADDFRMISTRASNFIIAHNKKLEEKFLEEHGAIFGLELSLAAHTVVLPDKRG